MEDARYSAADRDGRIEPPYLVGNRCSIACNSLNEQRVKNKLGARRLDALNEWNDCLA